MEMDPCSSAWLSSMCSCAIDMSLNIVCLRLLPALKLASKLALKLALKLVMRMDSLLICLAFFNVLTCN